LGSSAANIGDANSSSECYCSVVWPPVLYLLYLPLFHACVVQHAKAAGWNEIAFGMHTHVASCSNLLDRDPDLRVSLGVNIIMADTSIANTGSTYCDNIY